MLRQKNQYREVREGDLIFFTTGPEGAHQFYNHTKEACKMLAISTLDELEIAEYPDSRKINVSRLKKIFQEGAEVEYLKDEANPNRHWPRDILERN